MEDEGGGRVGVVSGGRGLGPDGHEKVGDGIGRTIGSESVCLGEEGVDDAFEGGEVLIVEEKEDACVDVFGGGGQARVGHLRGDGGKGGGRGGGHHPIHGGSLGVKSLDFGGGKGSSSTSSSRSVSTLDAPSRINRVCTSIAHQKHIHPVMHCGVEVGVVGGGETRVARCSLLTKIEGGDGGGGLLVCLGFSYSSGSSVTPRSAASVGAAEEEAGAGAMSFEMKGRATIKMSIKIIMPYLRRKEGSSSSVTFAPA